MNNDSQLKPLNSSVFKGKQVFCILCKYMVACVWFSSGAVIKMNSTYRATNQYDTN